MNTQTYIKMLETDLLAEKLRYNSAPSFFIPIKDKTACLAAKFLFCAWKETGDYLITCYNHGHRSELIHRYKGVASLFPYNLCQKIDGGSMTLTTGSRIHFVPLDDSRIEERLRGRVFKNISPQQLRCIYNGEKIIIEGGKVNMTDHFLINEIKKNGPKECIVTHAQVAGVFNDAKPGKDRYKLKYFVSPVGCEVHWNYKEKNMWRSGGGLFLSGADHLTLTRLWDIYQSTKSEEHPFIGELKKNPPRSVEISRWDAEKITPELFQRLRREHGEKA